MSKKSANLILMLGIIFGDTIHQPLKCKLFDQFYFSLQDFVDFELHEFVRPINQSKARYIPPA